MYYSTYETTGCSYNLHALPCIKVLYYMYLHYLGVAHCRRHWSCLVVSCSRVWSHASPQHILVAYKTSVGETMFHVSTHVSTHTTTHTQHTHTPHHNTHTTPHHTHTHTHTHTHNKLIVVIGVTQSNSYSAIVIDVPVNSVSGGTAGKSYLLSGPPYQHLDSQRVCLVVAIKERERGERKRERE